MLGDNDNRILDLSRDIGKVSERTGRLEEGFQRFERKIDTFMDESRARAETREARDARIADHMSKVCALARLASFFLKFVCPPGGLIAIGVAGRQLGWW